MKRIGDCLSGYGLLSFAILIATLAPMIALCQEANASGNPAAAQPGETQPAIKVFRVGKFNVRNVSFVLGLQFKAFPVGEDSVGVIGTPSDLQRAAQMVDTLTAALHSGGALSQETIYVSVIGASLAGQSGEFPGMLAETVKELESIFPYKGYVLLDTFPVLVDSGSNSYSAVSMLARCRERFNMPCDQTIKLSKVALEGDSISVGLLEYNLQVPIGPAALRTDDESRPQSTQEPALQQGISTLQVGIHSGFTLKRNQTLVLGKLSTVAGEDAIFVAVSRLAR